MFPTFKKGAGGFLKRRKGKKGMKGMKGIDFEKILAKSIHCLGMILVFGGIIIVGKVIWQKHHEASSASCQVELANYEYVRGRR